MIYSNDTTAAKSLTKQDNNKQSTDINRDLWRQALEKNGLYQALNEFEVEKNPNKKQIESSLENTEKNQQNSSSESELNTSNILGGDKSTDAGTKSSLYRVNNYTEHVVDRTAERLMMNEVGFTNFSTTSKTGADITNTLPNVSRKLLSSDKQWLDKNALVTLTNSNFEVWIRDANLLHSNVARLLSDIRQSMGSLGANLVKISINGKVYFERNK